MYEIETLERKQINRADSLVQASFELPGHDWCELSMLQEWKAVENRLSQMKNTNSQIRHKMVGDLLEKP